jgi:hypothetical protein
VGAGNAGSAAWLAARLRVAKIDLVVTKVLSRLAPFATPVARPESSDYAICMMPIAMRACQMAEIAASRQIFGDILAASISF